MSEILFTPLKIGTLVAPNRIAINAMECCDALENGDPSPATYARYENLFKGQAGIIFLEAITPQYKYRSRLNQLSIAEHNLDGLKKFVARMKELNPEAVFLFQITHSGETSNNVFAKRSRITEEPLYGYEDAEFVGEEGAEQAIKDYVLGSRIAYEAGADGVDLKLCHGYLGTQILRPFNKADWKYGGKWENRRQFAIDLYDRVKSAVNDDKFLLGSKISMYEGFPGGVGTMSPDSPIMDLSESIDLVQQLEKHGMHYVLQSAGSPSHTLALAHPDIKVPDYAYMHFYFQKSYRDNLKPETAVIGSGYTIFRNGKAKFQAVKPEKNSIRFWGNKNISEKVVDAIAIGRQSYADPFMAKKMIDNEDASIKWCTLCDHCVEMLIRQKPVGCATFDKHFTEEYVKMRKEMGALNEKHT